MQVQVAKTLGAQVATTVRNDAKGQFANAVGAELVINTSREDFVERVKEWTNGLGADVVIDSLGGDGKVLRIVSPLHLWGIRTGEAARGSGCNQHRISVISW